MKMEVTVPCKECGNKVPVSSLKMDIDMGKMVCPDCIKNKHIHKEIEKDVFHKKEEKQYNQETTKKVGHKCNSCGYKFMINPETGKPKNCPYCNARVTGF